MYNCLQCISQLYSAPRPGSCKELKVRAVHRSFRSGVQYRYLYFDTYALMMMMMKKITMTVMVVLSALMTAKEGKVERYSSRNIIIK